MSRGSGRIRSLRGGLTYICECVNVASMKLESLQTQAGRAERLLKAMASRPRLMILCELVGGEHTVTELQHAVGIAMSAVSQHLAKLREAEIVTTRRESQTIYYSLSSDAVRQLLNSLYTIFCVAKPQSQNQQEKTS